MIYSLQQNLLSSSGPVDLLDQQSRRWSMVSSLLLIVLLFLLSQNMNPLVSLASKSNNIQNVVNLEYRIVPSEPKPTPKSPPELVEPVLQEVQEIVAEPPPVAKEIVKKLEKAVEPRPIKAVQKKKKIVPKQMIVPATVTPQEPAKEVAEPVPEEPASYEQAQVDSIPAVISKDKPDYPYRARRMNVTGFVEIRFLVNKNGRVEELEILQEKPAGTFDESVRKTVMGWRFNPGIKSNRSVATWMTTTINFELE